jgi:hypothetical protein
MHNITVLWTIGISFFWATFMSGSSLLYVDTIFYWFNRIVPIPRLAAFYLLVIIYSRYSFSTWKTPFFVFHYYFSPGYSHVSYYYCHWYFSSSICIYHLALS